MFIGGGASQGQISVLENAINLRVAKGEVMSQINIEAGRTLIQSNRLVLDANSVVFTGTAFIPSAQIQSLHADKITAGTIDSARINATQIVTQGLTANVIKSTHIETSAATIDKLFATDAMVNRLTAKTAFITSIQAIDISAARITSGTINSARINATEIVTAGLTANVIKSTHIETSTATVDKIFATDAMVNQLTAKSAFISSIRAVTIDASRITSGTIDSARINATQIVTQGLTANVIKSTHIETSTATIDKLFATTASVNALTSNTAFINNIRAIDISADRITSGTINASNINVININANSIAGNEANLISAMFNGTHSQLLLTGSSVGMMRLNDNTGYAFAITSSEARFDLPINMYAPLFMRTRPLYFGTDRNDQYIQSEGNTLQFRSGLSNNNVQMSVAPGQVNVYATTQMHGNLAMNLNQIFYSAQAAIRSQGNTLQFRIDATTLMSVGNNSINMWRQLNMNGLTITNSPSLSDERLKEFDWESDEDSLSIVRSWKLGRYRFNEKAEHEFGLIGQNEFGLSAQNTPDLMTYTAAADIYGVNHLKWTARNSHAIQQLAEEHENTLVVASAALIKAECVDEKVIRLEARVKELEQKLEETT